MERDPRLELLAETRARIAEMEKLLEELPAIFESRFQQRLEPLLEQQRQLQQDNDALRQQLRRLRGSEAVERPRRLLALPGRRLRAVFNAAGDLSRDDDVPPTAASAGPTRR